VDVYFAVSFQSHTSNFNAGGFVTQSNQMRQEVVAVALTEHRGPHLLLAFLHGNIPTLSSATRQGLVGDLNAIAAASHV
jgi:hypothetical protein